MVRKKNSLVFLLCLFCIGMLVGCGQKPKKLPQDVFPSVTPIPSQEVIEPVSGQSSSLVSTKTIQYYSVNSITEQKEPMIAMLSATTEVTPELIMEYVLDSMDEQEILIEVDSLVKQEDTIVVNFSDRTEFLKLAGNKLENEILDSIAQSLLDNLDAYSKVIYRVMEEAYKSENNSFPIDYVYLEKEK